MEGIKKTTEKQRVDKNGEEACTLHLRSWFDRDSARQSRQRYWSRPMLCRQHECNVETKTFACEQRLFLGLGPYWCPPRVRLQKKIKIHRKDDKYTIERGRYRLRLNVSMVRVNRTIKTANAAFSRSVSWISMLRNSTRHPMSELGGGGLNRMVCQLVDWMF